MSHYVDAHCHIDTYPVPSSTANETEAAGVYTIAVTNSPSAFDDTLRLTEGRKFIRAALGFHPELVAERYGERDAMWQLLGKTRYIGEVGLDYSNATPEQRAMQRQVFDEVLGRSARIEDRVLTVHSRKTATDVIAAIGEHYSATIILHWFSGTLRELSKAVSCGMYFSVNHRMAASQSGRKLIAAMPPDKILTESDGPYTKIGREVARPSLIHNVVSELGVLWGLSHEQARERIFANFRAAIQPKTVATNPD